MEILYTARFLRSLKKLTAYIQDDVIIAIGKFKQTKNHNQIKLHKLSGEMKGYSAFSANYRYRVIVKMEKKVAYCMDVSTHDVYR